MPAHMVGEEGDVRIWSLLGSGDQRRVEALLELYARLFPQYAHYVPRMRRRASFGAERRPGHIVHYWLLEVDGQPAGLRTFRYVRSRHVGLAHALAVDPAYRQVQAGGQRLSHFLVRACLDQVSADARRLGDPPVFGMVNEIESRRLMEHYKKMGILELPVEYVEPIFPAGMESLSREQEIALAQFSRMSLGFLPDHASGIQQYTGEMIADFSLAFLVDHYGLPADHWQVRAVLNSIPVLS